MQHCMQALRMHVPAEVCTFLISERMNACKESFMATSQGYSISCRASVATHHSLLPQCLQLLQGMVVWVLQVIPGLFCLRYPIPCAL